MQLVKPLHLFWLLHVHSVWWGELLLVCIWMSQYCGVLCNVIMSCVTCLVCVCINTQCFVHFCSAADGDGGGNNRGGLPWAPKQCWTHSNTHLFSGFRSKSTTYRALASSGLHSSRVRWNVYWSWGPSSISEKQKKAGWLEINNTAKRTPCLSSQPGFFFLFFFFVVFFAL